MKDWQRKRLEDRARLKAMSFKERLAMIYGVPTDQAAIVADKLGSGEMSRVSSVHGVKKTPGD